MRVETVHDGVRILQAEEMKESSSESIALPREEARVRTFDRLAVKTTTSNSSPIRRRNSSTAGLCSDRNTII